jgi:small subunit ribosomal protein S20
MPNTKSAAKNVRKSAKLNARNRWRKLEVKTAIKDFSAKVEAGSAAEAEKSIPALTQLLDKVSSTSSMHKNTASRYKSRLTKRLNALKAAAKKA